MVELERTAHTIKGLAANIGAINLSDISKKIEDTLDTKLFTKFYEELNKVLHELKNLSQNEPEQNLLEIDNIKRNELFTLLKEFATKRRAKQCNEIINKLNQYELLSEDKNLIVQIEELLNKRDYKNIMEIV